MIENEQVDFIVVRLSMDISDWFLTHNNITAFILSIGTDRPEQTV